MSASEKEFVLTHVFRNVSSMKEDDNYFSPIEEHFEVPWKINAMHKKNNLSLFLHCDQKQEKSWAIDTAVKVKVKGPNRIAISRSYERTFNEDFSNWGWHQFISCEDLMENYVIGDTLRIDAYVKIKKMTGIDKKGKKNLRDVDESRKQFSDVVLVVENQKFYVLKLYLASQSTYFEALFLRNFEESTKPEITLSDINANDFQNFLELLHGESPIDESTIVGITHLADIYDAELAIRKCEQFLIENSKKSMKEKLHLAHRYNLQNLKDACLSKINTVAEIRSCLTEDLNLMDHSVVGELLQKSLALHDDSHDKSYAEYSDEGW